MYVLDTNVVTEIRKAPTHRADRNVIAWAKSIPPSNQYLSVITILELEIGILRLERRDPRQGKVFRSWLQGHVLPAFNGRILEIDFNAAVRCAALHVPNPCSYRDSLIAATALIHGMTVVTRNVSDFASTGVALLNPWES